MSIYGQEGGLPDPLVKEDLCDPQELTFEKGEQTLEFSLERPLLLDQDHFFVEISEVRGRVDFIADNVNAAPSCYAEDGGNYTPTLLYDGRRLIQSTKTLKIDYLMAVDTSYDAIRFTDVSKEILGVRPYAPKAVSCGDIDAAGYLDLLIDRHLLAGVAEGRYKELTRKYHLPVQNGMKHLMLDVDNDGDLDMIFFRGMAIVLFKQTAPGTFEKAPQKFPRMPHLSSLAYADVTGNGYLDVVVTQQWSHYPKPEPDFFMLGTPCLLYTSPSPRDRQKSRMPSSA